MVGPEAQPVRNESAALYICNCNGLRQRDARAAIEAGASRPVEIFRHHGCAAQCAKCVCEMRRMIQAAQAQAPAEAFTSEEHGAPSRRLG